MDLIEHKPTTYSLDQSPGPVPLPLHNALDVTMYQKKIIIRKFYKKVETNAFRVMDP